MQIDNLARANTGLLTKGEVVSRPVFLRLYS